MLFLSLFLLSLFLFLARDQSKVTYISQTFYFKKEIINLLRSNLLRDKKEPRRTRLEPSGSSIYSDVKQIPNTYL